MVSQDWNILSVLINDGNSVIKILSTALRSFHDKVYRRINRVFCLKNIFLCICSYIQVVTKLRGVLRKGDKRSVNIMRGLKTMLRTIRSNCSECIRIHDNPSLLLKSH